MNYIKVGTNKNQFVISNVAFSTLDVGDNIFVSDRDEAYGNEIRKVHKSTPTFIALECEECVVYLEMDVECESSFGLYVVVTDKDDRILSKFYCDVIYLDGDGYISQGRIRNTIKDLF